MGIVRGEQRERGQLYEHFNYQVHKFTLFQPFFTIKYHHFFNFLFLGAKCPYCVDSTGTLARLVCYVTWNGYQFMCRRAVKPMSTQHNENRPTRLFRLTQYRVLDQTKFSVFSFSGAFKIQFQVSPWKLRQVDIIFVRKSNIWYFHVANYTWPLIKYKRKIQLRHSTVLWHFKFDIRTHLVSILFGPLS